MSYKHNINSEISITYIVTKKRLTLVAALGVTVGISIYIFMNCMTAGFDRKSNELVFRNSAHIRVYKDDEISRPLLKMTGNQTPTPIIVNPKVVPESNKIVDPARIVEMMATEPDVTGVTEQVAVEVFYNNGKSQISGNAYGVHIMEADSMFDIHSMMQEGSLDTLKTTPNGIIPGVGIAAKMNLNIGENITITSSRNVTKVMKVVGIFKTNNSALDKSKSYVNIGAAQQLMKEGPSYVTDINIDVTDFDKAPDYSEKLSSLTGYKAEDWKAANETVVASAKMRGVIISAITLSVLLIAGFGIYNILNMTISQKINDIAILKAMGFRGKDVVRIFVQQGLVIGLMGIVAGLLIAYLLIWRLSKTYIGGDIGYFPVQFDTIRFIRGIAFGLLITLFAGYIPARRAANVDPVSILRK